MRPALSRREQPAAGRLPTVLLAVLLSMVTAVGPAIAYWTASGFGAGTASTGSLQPPAVSVQAVGGSSVQVDWTGAAGEPSPMGFHVVRDSVAGPAGACGTSPTALITAASCTDLSVGDGTYTYVVTAVHRSWTAVSEPSSAVVVHDPDGAPALAEATTYSVLGRTGVTSTGSTTVSGDLGVSPSEAVVGFGPGLGVVSGTIHANDQDAAAAQVALGAAYADLKNRTNTSSTAAAHDLGGLTVTPGVHHVGGALAVTGTLTLDAGGDPDAVFVFKVNGALTVAATSAVVLVNGARASNVFWQVEGAAGTGANSTFAGTILAAGAITLGDGASLIGRALSHDAVTLANNTIRFTVAPPPALAITGDAAVVTKDVTPTVAGTTSATPGRTVTVTVGGQILSATVQADGTWSVTAAELVAGTYPVVAKVRDEAGNGSTANQTLTVEVNPAPVMLGAATSFAVLAPATIASTSTVENPTTVRGDLGVAAVAPTGTIGGFPPGIVDGIKFAPGDAAVVAARDAFSVALTDAAGRAPHTTFSGDVAGRTFHAGVHRTSAAFALTGELTLDGENDPDAVFIFQVSAALNTAAQSRVVLVRGARASNVFWIASGAVGTGAGTSFAGTILTNEAITLGAGTQLAGRALSGGVVTLANNAITNGTPS